MKKALIIGGSGFVGPYLCRELLSAGYEVVLTANGETVAETDWNWANLDILNAEAVHSLLNGGGFDCVFHLAAQSSAAVSWKKPGLTIDVNVQGTLNVLETLRTMEKPPRLLLIGSSEEYGAVRPEDCPISEELPCHPGNPYAVSKLCAEQLGLLYAGAYGLEVLCTRSFNHVGPGQAPGFVLPDFCRQIAALDKSAGDKVMSVGNLPAKRDFSDVRDVVRAYRLLMERGRSGRVYNVGSGKAVAVGELLERLLKLSDADIRAEIDPEKFRPIDVPLHVADVSALREDTRWEAEKPLEETLQSVLNEWREKV